jgi:hypothetical protein
MRTAADLATPGDVQDVADQILGTARGLARVRRLMRAGVLVDAAAETVAEGNLKATLPVA